MRKQPLSETNPFLKDPEERRFWLVTTVASSAAIEGVHLPKAVIDELAKESEVTIRPVYVKSSARHR